jgi:hypothetical protein
MSDVEAKASFEAWCHSEAGLDYRDMAMYTPQELNRLQLGWAARKRAEQQANARARRRARDGDSGRRQAVREANRQQVSENRGELREKWGVASTGSGGA